MGQGAQSQGKFLGTDLASIAAGPGFANHGSEFTSQDLQVWDVKTVLVHCKVTGGNAANVLDCVFKFVSSLDGVNWSTMFLAELEVPMVGVNAIVYPAHLNVEGAHSLRLQQIENKETVAGRTATVMNVQWGKSFNDF